MTFLVNLEQSDKFESNHFFNKNRGNSNETRGTAFVVYEDIYDAKNAVDHLSGFNVAGRYLICLYYQPGKAIKKIESTKK
jgi:pre-mRNA branch site protein p14